MENPQISWGCGQVGGDIGGVYQEGGRNLLAWNGLGGLQRLIPETPVKLGAALHMNSHLSTGTIIELDNTFTRIRGSQADNLNKPR